MKRSRETTASKGSGKETVRELERNILEDAKNSNLLLTLRKHMLEGKAEETLAAIHSFRRIFNVFLESGKLETVNAVNKAKSGTKEDEKIQEYKIWLIKQYYQFQDSLKTFIKTADTSIQIPAIKTMIDLTAKEYMTSAEYIRNKNSSDAAYFGIRTFKELIESLLLAKELSAETLILLREELFSMPDCVFYSLNIIKLYLRNYKKQNRSLNIVSADQRSQLLNEINTVVANSLDILRMIPMPEAGSAIDRSYFLVNCTRDTVDGGDGESDSDEDSDHDDTADDEVSEEEDVAIRSRKRDFNKIAAVSSKSKSKMSRHDELVTYSAYQKLFSKVWILFLSMPLTTNQHKLVLKHLPVHVMSILQKPLLLSDYLTLSYQVGGVISILALESLFELIRKYNLDYPDFFISLYKLCTTDTFCSKYREKFIKLLSLSLQSTNLPAYLVASFIKRLAYLSLHVVSPMAVYCVAQITWLLRKHPQCIKLIHRLSKSSKYQEYIVDEDSNLENNYAITSSLWEMTALQAHHLESVVFLSNSLQDPKSTSNGVGAIPLVVNDYLHQSYGDLIEEELKKIKKRSNLAYKVPNGLFEDGGAASSCFV